MSEDLTPRKGIVFGSEQSDESEQGGVRPMRFPDNRCYRWMPVAATGTPPPDVALVVTQAVLERLSDPPENGEAAVGYLLGHRYVCPETKRDFVIVDKHTHVAGATTLTSKAWASLVEELRDGRTLIGWYHQRANSHSALAAEDAAITLEKFADSWMCAGSLDPATRTGALYARRASVLDAKVPVEFYELLDASSEGTAVSWNGYTCFDASSGREVNPARQSRGASAADRPTAAAEALPRVAASKPRLGGGHVAPFPFARTFHWVPDTDLERQQEIAILVAQDVLLATTRHVSENVAVEIGGFLLGNCYRCPNTHREYVIIDQFSPAQFTEATSVSLAFGHDAWARLHDELTGKFLGKTLVGWYHSHPRMGIFLSSHDVQMYNERFAHDFMSALVIDPVKMTAGFFSRRGEQVETRKFSDFYEYVDVSGRAQHETVMSWNGYVCRDSQSGAAIEPPRKGSAAVVSVATTTATTPDRPSLRRPDPPRPQPARSKVSGPVMAAAAAALVVSTTAGWFGYRWMQPEAPAAVARRDPSAPLPPSGVAPPAASGPQATPPLAGAAGGTPPPPAVAGQPPVPADAAPPPAAAVLPVATIVAPTPTLRAANSNRVSVLVTLEVTNLPPSALPLSVAGRIGANRLQQIALSPKRGAAPSPQRSVFDVTSVVRLEALSDLLTKPGAPVQTLALTLKGKDGQPELKLDVPLNPVSPGTPTPSPQRSAPAVSPERGAASGPRDPRPAPNAENAAAENDDDLRLGNPDTAVTVVGALNSSENRINSCVAQNRNNVVARCRTVALQQGSNAQRALQLANITKFAQLAGHLQRLQSDQAEPEDIARIVTYLQSVQDRIEAANR